jgi:hypothetical protein
MIADKRRWRAVLLLVLLPVVVVVEEIEGELEASQTHRLHYNLRLFVRVWDRDLGASLSGGRLSISGLVRTG